MSSEVRTKQPAIGGPLEGEHALEGWKQLGKTGAQQIRADAEAMRADADAKRNTGVKDENLVAQRALKGVAASKIRGEPPAAKKAPAEASPTSAKGGDPAALANAHQAYTDVKAQANQYQALVGNRNAPSAPAARIPADGAKQLQTATQRPSGAGPQASSPPHNHTVSVAQAVRGQWSPAAQTASPKTGSGKGRVDARGAKGAPGAKAPATRAQGKGPDRAEAKEPPTAAEALVAAEITRASTHGADQPLATTAGMAAAAPQSSKSAPKETKTPYRSARGVGKVTRGNTGKTGLAKLEAGARQSANHTDAADPLPLEAVANSIGIAPNEGDPTAQRVFNAGPKDTAFVRVLHASDTYRREVEKPRDLTRFAALAERVEQYVVEALSKRVEGDTEFVAQILRGCLSGSPYDRRAIFAKV